MGNAPTSLEPTADQVLKNVDLSSKTVIVTGANRGIGKVFLKIKLKQRN